LIWLGSTPDGAAGVVRVLVALLLEPPPQPVMERATLVSRAAMATVERRVFMG
jgi:hypothetical protein